MKALIFNIQKFSLHDGCGIRTTVFFKGCNLRCRWCANPESLSLEQENLNGDKIGRYYTLDELMSEILKDKPFYDKTGGGVTLSGGEPLLQPEFVCAFCDALHEAGINVGLETAANVPQDVFDRVIKKCDFAFIDLKHWNEEAHLKGTGVGSGLILQNLKHALEIGLKVTVRIPVIPGYNDSEADAREFSRLLSELGARDVHILPFHQLGESKYDKYGVPYAYKGAAQLHDEDLEYYAKAMSSGGLKVQIGG